MADNEKLYTENSPAFQEAYETVRKEIEERKRLEEALAEVDERIRAGVVALRGIITPKTQFVGAEGRLLIFGKRGTTDFIREYVPKGSGIPKPSKKKQNAENEDLETLPSLE